ncbi:MAG: hypothetical protein ACYC66_15970 [Chloroflexota bacterium]
MAGFEPLVEAVQSTAWSPESVAEAAAPPTIPEPVAEAQRTMPKPASLPSAGDAGSGVAGWLLSSGIFLLISGLVLRRRETQSL